MSFLENIGKKVGNAAQAAVKKSGELVEISKLSLNIKSEEDKIEKIYMEIGKSIYNKFTASEVVDEAFKGLCDEISEHEKNILELKDKIALVKNVKECLSCGKEIEKGIKFCPGCGAKQEDAEEIVEPQELKCPGCGAVISEGTAFCQSCGTKIE